MNWEAVIGLEVHAQLKTQSKIFSNSSTAYGAKPNTQANAVDIALPGTLPVMNQKAAELAVRFGLSIDAEINQRNVFARKNYFYPDLPKGYQISQMSLPIVGEGTLNINTAQGTKAIGITRAHLEEDAGKSLHENFHGLSGIDLNRAGTPLLEIVSEPDLRSAEEAVTYLKELHQLVQYLGICDGNMQEGSFRCDANVSIRPQGQKTLGTRAELKNINSFRFVERAIEYEISRQIDILEDGGSIVQETRLYDSEKNETRAMRSKEQAHDYRYFPDPDLPPMVLSNEFLMQIKQDLPELPKAKRQRFIEHYQLKEADAVLLTLTREVADYFEAVNTASQAHAKTIANWVLGTLFSQLNQSNTDIESSPIDATQFAKLIDRIDDNTLSNKTAKQVFELAWKTQKEIDTIIEEQGLKQISDPNAISTLITQIIENSPDQVTQFLDGNEKIIGYLVGQVMQKSQGKANPQLANQLLREQLQKLR